MADRKRTDPKGSPEGELGIRLQAIRFGKGYSQEKFARALGISKVWLGCLEHSRKWPEHKFQRDTIFRIAEELPPLK